MKTYTIIKFKDLTPLHIGTGKENYDFSASQLHSDTILSALASIMAARGDADKIKKFLNEVSVSSAFPYIANQYFLPKPIGKIDIKITDITDEHIIRKRLKKICYIEHSLWSKLIQGNTLEVHSSQIQGNFLCNDVASFTTPYQSQVNQRVTVPRGGNEDATPFFFDWTFFAPNAGLYCIVDCPEKWLSETLNLFTELGENGIGTDRSVGGGKFNIEQSSMSFHIPSCHNAALLLSMYIPTEDELKNIDLSQSRYELIKQGGFISASTEVDFRHLTKRSVHMFAPGSLLHTNQPLQGKIVDLKPDYNDARMHPVYRSGKPLYIPINIPIKTPICYEQS